MPSEIAAPKRRNRQPKWWASRLHMDGSYRGSSDDIDLARRIGVLLVEVGIQHPNALFSKALTLRIRAAGYV